MNKSTPRDRKPFSRSKDEDYKFLCNPLMRKAEDKVLTKRRDGVSPGRHGVKAPYPPTVPNVLYQTKNRSKYVPHQGQKERERRRTHAAWARPVGGEAK